MAFGNATFSDTAGAVSDLFASRATASGLRLKAEGADVEGTNYSLAADLAKQNEQFTEQSTAVKQAMSDRQIYLGIGTEEAEIAGAGFQNTGSALDLLRSSASQGALQKQLIGQQGLITEASFNEQATAYKNLAQYAHSTADTQRDMAGKAETVGNISAGIKGAAAIATLFVGS